MKVFLIILVVALFHFCAAQEEGDMPPPFRMYKVGHLDSPHKYGNQHGVALRMIEPDLTEHVFFDSTKDIFDMPKRTFTVCDGKKNCCNLDSMYPQKLNVKNKESVNPEFRGLSQLRNHYQHGVDAWILYYHLCTGPRKNLMPNNKDNENLAAIHSAIAETGSSYAGMKPFLAWFKSSTIQ